MLMWFWSVVFWGSVTLRNHTHTRVCTNIGTHPGDEPDLDPVLAETRYKWYAL